MRYRFLILSTFLPLVLVGTASAGNWLGHYAGYNSTVTVWQCNLSNKFHNAYHDNDAHDIQPTDISTSNVHGCGSGEVRVIDADWGPNGFYGWWECHQWGNNGITCEWSHVHINQYYGPYTNGQALSLMCEEFGHSVGLDHRPSTNDTSCMSGKFSERHLDGHDKGILNDRY